ncbi:OsmC family protein [Haloarchaeobius amylolyticus]|uniref:OsmC family protein n=1 Tax=Haloarchaeobius amylolyticus TaxID=1198296 RepID=UPI00226DA1A3|nr:OsmC family protein [Haloarchaeobius amylolyticus]
MSKEVRTISEEGFSATNEIRDFETTIDATGEDAPDTLESLLASYAACFVPALRVAAEQRQAGELGRVEIHTTGDLNEDDKLDAITFDVKVENEVGDKADAVVERAEALCKVHDALKESLHATVELEDGAF